MNTEYQRYYEIAGITIQVESDLPITDSTFSKAINKFEVGLPGKDNVVIRHHFSDPPPIHLSQFGELRYNKPPWKIYKSENNWIYQQFYPHHTDDENARLGVFSSDYSLGDIYHSKNEPVPENGSNSITFFPTDQIYLAPILAKRNGMYLHSAGAIINGKGILFIGHSSAGKSTTTRMLMKASTKQKPIQILCDDRNIVRKVENDWVVTGTWSHGDISRVSPDSARLEAICFIQKSQENSIKLITDQNFVRDLLLGHLIKSLTTDNWWDQILPLVSSLAKEIRAYNMYFEKSGEIIPIITDLMS